MMALYPFTTYTTIPEGPQSLPPGSGSAIPLVLNEGQRLDIDVILVDPGGRKQDFSLRAWISRTPMGSPNPDLSLEVQTWQPSRRSHCVVISFFDPSLDSDTIFAIPAAPGDYYLNVLDLSNSGNEFSVTITDTTNNPNPTISTGSCA